MREHDPLVGQYEHLDKLERAPEALHMLRKVASLVKPIMRNHGWAVSILAEFYPDQTNLLGMNYGNGRKIYLRLRHAGDQRQFLPLEHVVDTMLHELSHNVHGPHNKEFHDLWNKLRDEYDDLKYKGYTGEGFLSEGHRLGGARIPIHEMRRQARIQAEKRRAQQKNSGQRLGGTAAGRGSDMRNVIADAASLRNNITKGCGAGTVEGEKAAEQASRNGFRTKAEEDDANDRAIAQALWELLQEEEARGAGLQNGEWQSEGLIWDPSSGLDFAPPSSTPGPSRPPPHQSRSAPPIPTHNKPPPLSHPPQPGLELNPRTGKPISRLVAQAAPSHAHNAPRPRQAATYPPPPYSPPPVAAPKPRPPPTTAAALPPTRSWTCPTCTLWNPPTYLICDACGIERPEDTSRPPAAVPAPPSSAPPEGARLSGPPEGLSVWEAEGAAVSWASQDPGVKRNGSLGWNCRACGTFMEREWWTCSACGLMKESSA